MKNWISWVMVFSGILLLMGGGVIGGAVLQKLAGSYGNYSTGKVVVSMTREAGKDINNMLTLKDMEKFSSKIKTGGILAAAESSSVVKYGDTRIQTHIRGVNSNYLSFYTVDISEGGFFTKANEDEAVRVVLIDEELALELFKTIRVVGKKVEIFGKYFNIVGIISEDASILGTLTGKEEYTVFMPVNVLLELDSGTGISSLEVKTEAADLLGRNEDLVSGAVSAIGKEPSDYIIKDYQTVESFMRQKAQLIVFLPGIVLIYILALVLRKKVKSLYSLISAACRADYFSNALRTHKAVVFSEILRMILLIAGILAVWAGISFKFFIPPKYLPDELIDLSYYIDLIKDGILEGNSMSGYVPPPGEILLNAAQGVLNWTVCLAILAGIPLIYTGLYQLKRENISMLSLTVFCSLSAVASLAATAVTAIAAGIPPYMDIKAIFVLFIFIFINSIIFSKEREEVF